jgi:hypothetical protein
VLYAYHGIKSNSNRKDAILRNMPYLGIAGVGIGSTVFHATMKNYTQWCKFKLLTLQIGPYGLQVYYEDYQCKTQNSGFQLPHCVQFLL